MTKQFFLTYKTSNIKRNFFLRKKKFKMFLIAKNATLNNNLIFSNGRVLQNIILLLNKCSQMDAIDKFTNELVERKKVQWDILKQSRFKDI